MRDSLRLTHNMGQYMTRTPPPVVRPPAPPPLKMPQVINTVYDDKTNTHWEVGENQTVEEIKSMIRCRGK